MVSRKALDVASRVWRIPVMLASIAVVAYGFRTGALTNNWMTFASMIFLCLGLALNLTVLILNGGFMPVRMKRLPQGYQTSHKSMGGQTRAPFLGDWIPVAGGYLSPGDLCLVAAVVVYATEALDRLIRSS